MNPFSKLIPPKLGQEKWKLHGAQTQIILLLKNKSYLEKQARPPPFFSKWKNKTGWQSTQGLEEQIKGIKDGLAPLSNWYCRIPF